MATDRAWGGDRGFARAGAIGLGEDVLAPAPVDRDRGTPAECAHAGGQHLQERLVARSRTSSARSLPGRGRICHQDAESAGNARARSRRGVRAERFERRRQLWNTDCTRPIGLCGMT